TDKDEALARYAMEGLPNEMPVRKYLTALPKKSMLAAEIASTRELWRSSEIASALTPASVMIVGFGLRSASGEVEWRRRDGPNGT
ncbi:MAG: hypothetical protein ABI651_21120, partial [Verrucomicrobiota bacterium]